jgi:hypothetical protein
MHRCWQGLVQDHETGAVTAVEIAVETAAVNGVSREAARGIQVVIALLGEALMDERNSPQRRRKRGKLGKFRLKPSVSEKLWSICATIEKNETEIHEKLSLVPSHLDLSTGARAAAAGAEAAAVTAGPLPDGENIAVQSHALEALVRVTTDVHDLGHDQDHGADTRGRVLHRERRTDGGRGQRRGESTGDGSVHGPGLARGVGTGDGSMHGRDEKIREIEEGTLVDTEKRAIDGQENTAQKGGGSTLLLLRYSRQRLYTIMI